MSGANFYIGIKPPLSPFHSSVSFTKDEQLVKEAPLLKKESFSLLPSIGKIADHYLSFSHLEWRCYYQDGDNQIPIRDVGPIRGWHRVAKKDGKLLIAFKVVSFATLIFPLLALIAKGLYRALVIRSFESSLLSMEGMQEDNRVSWYPGVTFREEIQEIKSTNQNTRAWKGWLRENDLMTKDAPTPNIFKVLEILENTPEKVSAIKTAPKGSPFIKEHLLAAFEARMRSRAS